MYWVNGDGSNSYLSNGKFSTSIGSVSEASKRTTGCTSRAGWKDRETEGLNTGMVAQVHTDTCAHGTRDMGIGHTHAHGTRDMGLGHACARGTRDMRLGHTRARGTRDMGLGHTHARGTRDMGLGHTHACGTRDMGLGHTHARGTRDMGLGHTHAHDMKWKRQLHWSYPFN